MSILVLIRDWWYERLRIKVSVVKWFASLANNQPFFIWMVIQNNSKLPCSIIKMEIDFVRNGEPVHATSHGSKAVISTIKRDNINTDLYSLDYPLSIDGYKSIGGYIHFRSSVSHSNFEDQTVNLTIYTNRGNVTQKIRLNFGDNIMRVYQHRMGELKVTLDSNSQPIVFTMEEL